MSKGYSISIDDSSDEEDEVQTYDITEKIQEFKIVKKETLDQDDLLSFITHATSIYSLYSLPVQKRYYELKKEKLSTELSFKSDEEIKEEINSSLEARKSYAGKNWVYDNYQKMQSIFSVIKEDMFNKIVQDKRAYTEAILKYESDSYLAIDNLFKEKDLKPEDMPNLSNNFPRPSVVNQFTRKTLDNPYFNLSAIAEEDFVVEFLSYLRLHNRSEKRHINNGEKCKNTTWTVFESKEAVELDNQNEYSGCRNEQVHFNSKWDNYSMILSYPKPEEVQVLLDAGINIKRVHNPDNLSSKSLSLWYLLFGCEVIKNPSALIHHNMAFDLVKARKLEWTEDDNDQMIEMVPMFKAGMIKEAMKLNSEYSEFMPHKYLYQKNDAYVLKDLVKREACITKKWLELKLGKAVSGYLINQCVTDNNAAKAIWELILESFDGWGLQCTIYQQQAKVAEKDKIVLLAQEFEAKVKIETVTNDSSSSFPIKMIQDEYKLTINNHQMANSIYRTIENKGGGDCAVYAIQDAFRHVGHNITDETNTLRKGIADTTAKFFPLWTFHNNLEKQSDEDESSHKARVQDIYSDGWQKLREYYQDIFQDIDTFKTIVIQGYIKNQIKAEGIALLSIKSLEDLEAILQDINSWADIKFNQTVIEQISNLCNTFDINIDSIISDHGLNKNNDTIKDLYFSKAQTPGVWLNNSEINAYLLTKGYVLKTGGGLSNGTYITYKSIVDNEEMIFYNNALDSNVSEQSAGTHWMAAVLNLDNLNIVQEPIVDAMMGSIQTEIHNFDYVKSQQIELIGQDHHDTI